MKIQETLSKNLRSWFSQLQPRSLTSWVDIKTAFLNKFLYDAAATRQRKFDDMMDKMIKGQEKELMSRFSQMLGIVYTEPNEESETMNTQIKKPDIEVQWTDETARREEADITGILGTGVPSNGDPEAGVLPGVWRNSIPEYFSPTVCPLLLDFVIELGEYLCIQVNRSCSFSAGFPYAGHCSSNPAIPGSTQAGTAL
ncbi:hypothetical protein F2Q70_00003217 [Brassica cretica]|uniref:Retrotransposon gag domain-containing protein n=1 Tax=Brassica cretica TaxID=69181 RepID=A0A8S9IKG4_BRACR|nr:hypothetical protein F2Q70_00003217 [Brassica cretica]